MEEATERLFHIRELIPQDRNWVAHFMDTHWGSTKIVTRGRAFYGHLLPGFAAELNDAPDDAPPAGLVTYNIEGDSCEIVTINSLQSGMGIGNALLEQVKEVALEAGCKRLWLVTTNDNMEALIWYQRRGFVIKAVYPNALAESRKLKPQIPLVGLHGIPLRDEIELQLLL